MCSERVFDRLERDLQVLTNRSFLMIQGEKEERGKGEKGSGVIEKEAC